jgi:hypothetical protein
MFGPFDPVVVSCEADCARWEMGMVMLDMLTTRHQFLSLYNTNQISLDKLTELSFALDIQLAGICANFYDDQPN